MDKDKTIIEQSPVQVSGLNPVKVAAAGALGGAALASGAFVAWGMARNGDTNPEILQTAQGETLTVQRNEAGGIEAVLVDENSDGQNDLAFAQAQSIAPDGQGLQTATSVNNEMSFAQAFGAARQEVGAGGVFEWRGQLYGTYYQDEWEGMSPEQRNHYGQEVAQYASQHASPATEAVAQAQQTPPPTETVAHTETKAEAVLMGEVDIDEDGVTDGVLLDTNHDGRPDAMQIDANHNGIADALAVDENADGTVDAIYIDQNEDGQAETVTDAEGKPIGPEADPSTLTNEQASDFDNNADVSDWV